MKREQLGLSGAQLRRYESEAVADRPPGLLESVRVGAAVLEEADQAAIRGHGIGLDRMHDLVSSQRGSEFVFTLLERPPR